MDKSLYLDEITKNLDENVNRLQFACTKLPYRGVNWTYYHSVKSIIVEWIRQQQCKFESQEQSGQYFQKFKDLYKYEKKCVEAQLRSENLFYKPVFKANFTVQFSLNNHLKQRTIFSYMNYIVQGYIRPIESIYEVEEIPISGQPLERMFGAKILNNKHLIFMVSVQQIPVESFKKNLVKVEFLQCIVFLDILNSNQFLQLKLKSNAKTYNKVIQNYISEPGYTVNQSIISPYKTDSSSIFQLYNGVFTLKYESFNQSNHLIDTSVNPFYHGITPFTPNKFFPHKILDNEKDLYIWNDKKSRWILQDQNFLNELQSMKEYQEQVSSYVISQCLNFGSADKLVQVLQRIPNFKVKLSKEQSHIISCSGNVVCIGRSGTGKTTSAVLRMFALEMLFKYRLSLYHQKNKKKLEKTRFNPKDIDKNVGIRCLFITASPVLTNEIRRYYDRLTKQLKEELIKRDEKLQAEQLEKQLEMRKQKEQQENETETDVIFQEEQEQVELMMEKDFENLTLKKEISTEDPDDKNQNKEQNIEEDKINFEEDDEEKLQKDMDRFENLNSMTPHDFPQFMTVRNLIMLIDASLSYPFFKRNSEGKIKGQTVQNTWHNEQKGTLYINNYHKQNLKVGNLKDDDGIPKDTNSFSDDEEDEIQNENLNAFQMKEVYMKTLRQQEKKINQIASQRVKQINHSNKMAYEVDFEYFKRFFWKRVQNRVISYKQLDVHFVWTEIYSVIKGSSQSCYYWSGQTYGMSKSMYKDLVTRLSPTEVDKLYEIYNEYEYWKNTEGCFDFMDVVNYIIRALNYGQNKNMQNLHYIMVDEVQDLPMNVLSLMKKICTHGIFYSGDTAQTIAQGVGFRYGSLKQLFQTTGYYNDSSLSSDLTIQQLTINFRSHNKILYLANSVIDLLEFFFPETIDRLKKEKSQIDGPKPIILGEGDPELLFCILTGEQNYKSQRHSSNEGTMGRNPIEFGCSQVVLVRNQESKSKLPAMLSHALCLTIYEAKGLEFDDVILYNFFEDSPLDFQKWNLLRYIQYHSKYMSHNEYDEMLVQQEADRIDKLHHIQILRRDIIEQEWKDKQDHYKLQFTRDDKERLHKLKILNDRKTQREKRMEEISQQEQSIQSDAVYGIEKKGQKDLIQVVRLDLNKTSYEANRVSSKDYSQLCLELKQLYVAITRPKNRIIIYDENQDKRSIIQEYWERLGCVEIIRSEVLEGLVDQKNASESGINVKDALTRKSDTEQWKQQGLRMMKMRYYKQAMLCFEKSQSYDYMKQAKMFHLADHAKELLEESQREQIFLDQGIMEYSQISKAEKTLKQSQINASMRQARKEFTEVGENFFNLGQYKQAAKCFFSGLNYTRAADAYLKIGNKRSAAECYYIIQDYIKASELFIEINEYVKGIECLDYCEQWGKVLEIVNQTKGKMSYKTREIYIKRYAPLALEELVQNIGLSKIEVTQKYQTKQKRVLELIVKEQINEDDEEEIEDSQVNEEDNQKNEETEDKDKGQNNILDQVETQKEEKQEQDQQEEDSCEKIDFNDSSSEELESNEKITHISQNNKSGQSNKNDSIMDVDFSIIDQSKSQLQDVSVIEKSETQHDNTSFVNGDDLDISNLSLDIIRTKNQLSDFDHLSEIDPEDEWLKMETGSIAEIIQNSRNSGVFSCSEYSSINLMDLVSTKSQMIKTSADIFIQDEIMQQVIKYMSMFSENFKAEILKIKSKDALLTSRNEQHDETLTEKGTNDLLIDLDNISIDFLYLILDTLEHYNVFRLAIFVCNRYKLTRKVGRYLISIAHKFSPLAVEDVSLDSNYINLTPQKQKRIEKCIVANIAIHNLFEVINPEYLRLKEEHEIPDEGNSLGIEVFRGLFTLGYWKKILFIMDYQRSLNLAYYFGDFNSYKTIFLTMNKKYKNKAACISSLKNREPDFSCLPFDVPQSENDIEFAIVALEHLIQFQSSKTKLSKPAQLNLSFSTRSQALDEGQYETLPQFPSYFTYNAIFWKYINHKVSKGFSKNANEDIQFLKYMGQCFKSAVEILDKNDKFQQEQVKLRIFDIFSTYISFLFQLQFQDKLVQTLIQHIELDDFLNFTQVGIKLLNQFKSISNLQKVDYLVLRAIISPLKAKLNIKNSDLLAMIGQTRVCIHRTSKLITHFLTTTKNAMAKINIPQYYCKRIPTFEEFCLSKNQKVNEKQRGLYNMFVDEANQNMMNVRLLLEKGDKRSLESAELLLTDKQEKDEIKGFIQEIEFEEKKLKNRHYFLDLDCDYISSPLEDILEFMKDAIYKVIINLTHRKILGQIKQSSTKNYSIERLFQISSYSIAFSDIIKQADNIMSKTEGDALINKSNDYIPPPYKKYKKTNPMYKFFKLEYLKSLEDQNEQEDDEEIQEYLEAKGQKKKIKKNPIPLMKKCRRQLTQCLQYSYQGYWDASLHPFVKQTLLNISLKTIKNMNVQISHDFKKVQKYAQLLNLLGASDYVNGFKCEKAMKKYVNQITENVYNARNGLIQNYIDNTLNIQDVFFEHLEINEKINNLEYCAVWAVISYLASKNEGFQLHLNQNFLKYLPPLKFADFTTDMKDDNQVSVPSRFTLEISIQPIQSLDTIIEIFQFINDVLQKKNAQIIQRYAIFSKLLNLIFIILYNLKNINYDLAQEILTLIDFIDSEDSVRKITDQIDFWDELVQSNNERDIEELIPLFIYDRYFSYEQKQENADYIQEIFIENIIDNKLTTNVRENMCKSQILHDQFVFSKKLNASKIIIETYNYNKQEMRKAQSRLCKNPNELILLARFIDKQYFTNAQLVSANIKNTQLYQFFEINETLISNILFNITLNNVFDPLDYHYLLLLLDQANRKQEEYEKHLIQIIQTNDSSQMEQIQKLMNEANDKKRELLNWANIQFSKENEDPQIFFIQNKMSIAVKWTKLGFISDAKRLVSDINDNYKLKEATYFKTQIKASPTKIGNKLGSNKQNKQKKK